MAASAVPNEPNSPGMPELQAGDFFSKTQWDVFFSIADAVVPSVSPETTAGDDMAQRRWADSEYQSFVEGQKSYVQDVPDPTSVVRRYLEESPSGNPLYRRDYQERLDILPADARKQLGTVLSILATRVGSLLLTGYSTPIHEQPLHVREAILRSWQRSRLGTLRVLSKSLIQLSRSIYLSASPLATQVMGYPDVPVDRRPGPDFDFSFLQFPPPPPPPPPAAEVGAPSPPAAVLETDVVIVGSGCGGGVCAKVLAEAGHRVVVVDKGYYFPPSQLPMPQREAMHHLFENGGVLPTADTTVNLVAGACWGGGGTVNWSVALQTQGFVRREWARDRGLPFFASPAFQDGLDRVCAFMGVHEDVPHNHRGRAVLEGSRRLGWEARTAPQNTAGKPHWCGHCHLGCGSGEKQGPAVSWLPAAVRAGAQCVEGFQVERVLFETDSESGEKVAAGVVGRWTSRDRLGSVVGPAEERVSREVVIKAKKVIVSAGSLWTPVILTKSGLKNRHIGRNLHVHPVSWVGAYYDEEVRPWEGGIITSYCTSFENLDGHGHGVKLEPTCMVPYTILSNKPWRGGIDFKTSAARLAHFETFIALVRDRDTGSVHVDPDTGRPRVHYTPSAFDRAHALEGILALCRLCHASGAREIHPFLPEVEPFIRQVAKKNNDDDKEEESRAVPDLAFEAWLDGVRAVGSRTIAHSPFASAHQMGSCRMGSHPGEGVVDGRGRAWEARSLFVADASVFPSASGVNPMVTNMAIADWIARGVAKELAKGE